MKNAKIFLSAALAAAAVCSAAYAAVAVEDNTSSAQSSDTSETSEAPETSNSDSDSDSNSGLTSNYVHLSIPRGVARIDFRDGEALCSYPEIRAGARCHIPVGCSGTLTIDREGYTIISVKIGNSTSKRDMTKMSDGVYGFTILEGDTDMEVIFEGDNSETESSAPAPSEPVSSEPAPTTPTRPEPEPERDEPAETTTHESAPETDTNPDTGIALAAAPAMLASAAILIATKKRK